MGISFAVSDLGASQLNSHLIPQINQKNDEGVNVSVFYENLALPCLPTRFASSLMQDSYLYKGKVICTTLSTVRKCINLPTADTFFYVWDLEWLRMKNRPFYYLYNIYSKVPLIVRSVEHKKIMEDMWGAKVIGVVPFANLESIIKCLD